MKKSKKLIAFLLTLALCATPVVGYAQTEGNYIPKKENDVSPASDQTAIHDENNNITKDDTIAEDTQPDKDDITAEDTQPDQGDSSDETNNPESGTLPENDTDTSVSEEPVKEQDTVPSLPTGPATPDNTVTETEPAKTNVENIQKVFPTLAIQAHVQDDGWQTWKHAGETIGTTGQSKRLEAVRIKLEYPQNTPDENKYTGNIEYRVHVQDIGWMGWQSAGATAGTTGQRKRIEAIQVRFTGELSGLLNVYYRVHSADFGWLSWTSNGNNAGTEELSRQAEALEFSIVKKGETFSGDTSRSYIKGIKPKNILFTTHIQDIGDTKRSTIDSMLGTTGKSKRMEALTLQVDNNENGMMPGGIQYRTHIENIGWQEWKQNGQLSGTKGQRKRIEAIQIQLTGEIAKYYDIYYRAHVQNLGWMGWAKNGQSAGTSKMAYRMEALQIRLVLKGKPAPGGNSNYYKEGKNGWVYEGGYKFYYRNGTKLLDLDGIVGRQSSYYIKVNRRACTVTVYAKDGNNGYIIPVKRFACSVGLPSTPTPSDTYYTPAKYRWHTLMGPSYGQYCTRITGGILFHSVAGKNMTSYNLDARDYNMLGQPASHGCVRLTVRDAKWIYDNCPLKTKVTIYDSSNPGPLGKPATIKIPLWQTWDPTDPNIK